MVDDHFFVTISYLRYGIIGVFSILFGDVVSLLAAAKVKHEIGLR